MTYALHEENKVIDGHIVFQKIAADEGAENPLDISDAMGKIFSFNSRHINSINQEQAQEYLAEYGENAVALSYFEHGLCKWGVQGSMGNMPDFRWDGVSMAGLWIPDKYLLEETKDMQGDERRRKMEEYAAQACAEYTDWCNGDVYYIRVVAYPVKKHSSGKVYDCPDDYRFDAPVFEEAYGGILGSDQARKCLEDELMTEVKEVLENN